MKIGLALSGGIARGIAHLGVLQYLEERGIKPAILAGTSAGSLVGALYCSGIPLPRIKEIVASFSWKKLFKLSVPRKGLIRSSLLLDMIEAHLGQITFDELKIPLVVNAADLLSGEEVVMNEGLVALAVEASCAIPGIFTPVRRGSQLLVDGGLLDNVPTAHLQGRGLDYIIAVDVGTQKTLQKEPDSIFEILVQSFYIARHKRDAQAHEFADILIQPNLDDIAFWDVSKTDLLVSRGYQASITALGSIRFEKKTGLLSKWLGIRN
ncbi:MAG TPA: patatin-like phospholipase family protein [Candidatus Limnocylindrales bacterium]|nr:patatin-like phospholipase family protein [Candidatus Limnocylindrales bacterium]